MFYRLTGAMLRHMIAKIHSAAGDHSGPLYGSTNLNESGVIEAIRAVSAGTANANQKRAVEAIISGLKGIELYRTGVIQRGTRHYLSSRDNLVSADNQFHVIGRLGDLYHLVGTRAPNNYSARIAFEVSEIAAGWLETPPTDEAPSDIVITREANIAIVRPSDEALAAVPAGVRPFAVRIGSVSSSSTLLMSIDFEAMTITVLDESNTALDGGNPTAASLIADGRTAYREWLRLSMGRNMYNAEDAEKQRKARADAATRFSSFARRTPDTDKHVPTLPFIPHGFSSSRRWGIEVESGGARGVQAPEQWRRISDGSLRSAWDGYQEVQDFEPYDEEVTSFIHPNNCQGNASRHQFVNETYNRLTGNYDYSQNPEYVDPAACESCGTVTRTEHRTPQTITHRAQNDDCAEFVSPILVSMHSNGLKSLTDQLILQPQNASAGVHVHVEADDLSHAEVATLIFGYDLLEPILEASYQRESRRYCARRDASTVLDHARKLRQSKNITSHDVRGGDRYVTLNTTALNQHGTIEFRAMGPVYDYDYLVRWAMLCRELVNIVKAGVTTKQFSKVKSWQDLLNLLAKYGKEYVRAAVYEATGEVGHAATLAKAGTPITTEAADADLSALLTSGDAAHSTIRRMMAGVASSAVLSAEVVADLNRVMTERLVGAGRGSTSGRNSTWMV